MRNAQVVKNWKLGARSPSYQRLATNGSEITSDKIVLGYTYAGVKIALSYREKFLNKASRSHQRLVKVAADYVVDIEALPSPDLHYRQFCVYLEKGIDTDGRELGFEEEPLTSKVKAVMEIAEASGQPVTWISEETPVTVETAALEAAGYVMVVPSAPLNIPGEHLSIRQMAMKLYGVKPSSLTFDQFNEVLAQVEVQPKLPNSHAHQSPLF